MPQTAVDIAPLLRALRTALDDLYGDRLHSVVLYGSYARGEAADGADSDVDILVVLKGEVDPWRESERMSKLGYDIQLAFGRLIALYPVSEDRYQASDLPVLINVRREGIEV